MHSHDVVAAAAAERHTDLMTEAARRRLRRAAMAAVDADPGEERGRAIARYLRAVEERLENPGRASRPARSLTS